MSSKDSKLDNQVVNPQEGSAAPADAEKTDKPIRLSVKGAVRESGRHSKFELKLDPNSTTAKFEQNKLLEEQLESVDFYIEQGFLEVAFSTLERLEMVFPNHPLISERLDLMAQMEKESEHPFAAVEPQVKENSLPVDEDVKLEPVEELPAAAAAEGGPVFKIQTAELEAPSDLQEINVEPVSFDPDQDEAVESLYSTLSDDAANVVEQEFVDVQHGFRSLFEELEEEVDEKVEADFASHFNVGLAYFDIELFDDAIEEFQAAYRSIQNSGSHPRAFQCFMMLGRCFRIKGMPRPALIWLKRALDTGGRSEDEYRDARYELAGVHAELGEPQRALELYEQIADIKPDFRDVAQKIVEMRANS